MISGRISQRDIKLKASKTIDFGDAMKRLEGKLPSDVESLVKTAAHTFKAEPPPEFTETSLAKGRIYLNDMIENSQVDLDKVTIACKEFEERNRETFSQVSNDIKRISGQISDLRRKQIGANEDIRDLSRQRQEVLQDKQNSALGCEQVRLEKAADLQLKSDDLAVFDFILEATKCTGEDAAAFVQTNGSAPVEVCRIGNDELVLHFDSPAKQARLEKMLTARSRKVLRDALASVMTGRSSLMQTSGAEKVTSTVNTTTVAIPTFVTPTEAVQEAPPAAGQWKKCVNGKPNCGLLHDTMSIQWGIHRDLVDELKYEMMLDKQECDSVQSNFNEQLVIIGEEKTKAMELLTETISSIQEDSQEQAEKQDQYHELEHMYKKKMAECKMTIEEILYTNICAVRQVRDKLMAYSEVTPPEKIDDCDVEDWTPEDCSKICDDTCPQSDPYACGGWQTLTRRVVGTPNQYGIQCPALQMNKKCNQFKCAVNCLMSAWGGWSGCSAECEGGEQQRTRAILTKPKNGGQECDTTLDARSCNTESCDRDCTLNPWTEWSPCSMACGGGMQERVRPVLVPIRALGKCPGEKHPDRYETQECNIKDCIGDEICIAKQDLVIALDGSGSLKESGFEVLRDLTANLSQRYMGTYFGQEAMRVGVILFGQGTVAPDGTIGGAVQVSELTAEIDGLKEKIEALTWQKGITNMAQAFGLASRMLREKGREDAQASVLVITDGKPSMKFVTHQKVDQLKETNTMIYFAPVADFPSKDLDVLKEWASDPWETNYERIPGLLALSNNFPMFAQRLVAKFCPKSFSPSREEEKNENRGFMLIHERGYPDWACGGGHTNMGSTYQTPEECGLAVKEQGLLSFSYEFAGRWQGICWAEHLQVTLELWEKWSLNATDPECPDGAWWFSPFENTYAIYPAAAAEDVE